jgi:hypothetical protein
MRRVSQELREILLLLVADIVEANSGLKVERERQRKRQTEVSIEREFKADLAMGAGIVLGALAFVQVTGSLSSAVMMILTVPLSMTRAINREVCLSSHLIDSPDWLQRSHIAIFHVTFTPPFDEARGGMRRGRATNDLVRV